MPDERRERRRDGVRPRPRPGARSPRRRAPARPPGRGTSMAATPMPLQQRPRGRRPGERGHGGRGDDRRQAGRQHDSLFAEQLAQQQAGDDVARHDGADAEHQRRDAAVRGEVALAPTPAARWQAPRAASARGRGSSSVGCPRGPAARLRPSRRLRSPRRSEAPSAAARGARSERALRTSRRARSATTDGHRRAGEAVDRVDDVDRVREDGHRALLGRAGQQRRGHDRRRR